MQVSGPFSLRTVIAFPLKSRSRFPFPVYVPSATMTMSSGTAASIADCIVVYVSPGPTCSSAAGVVDAAKAIAAAIRNTLLLRIYLSSFDFSSPVW